MQTMGSGSIGETRRSGFKSQCSHHPISFYQSCPLLTNEAIQLKTQITRISFYQNAKILAILYMPIGLIYALIGAVFLLMDVDYLKYTGYIFLSMPLWLSLAVVGAHYAVAAVYNYLASKVGGFEFEFTEVED